MDATTGRPAQACRIPEMDDSAMRLSFHLTRRQRTLPDAALDAYREWRGECAAVRASYQRWAGARREEESSAFNDYRSALDREECAAKQFARLMRRASDLAETGIALQLARIQVGDGSC